MPCYLLTMAIFPNRNFPMDQPSLLLDIESFDKNDGQAGVVLATVAFLS